MLIARGDVRADELSAASVEADLLEHPYVGVEHVELARLKAAGRFAEREQLLHTLTPGVPRWRWRPLGRNSALRRRGLAETRAARFEAERDDGADPSSP